MRDLRPGLTFKKSNIRIWIHQRNLMNLQQVVWEGHGSKLLVEHSNNSKVKKFLEAVPHIMCLIKDIHTDVQNGDLESLKSRIAPPVPPIVLSGKDSNGLTPLHKAVGLGKQDIAEFIVSQYPESIHLVDNEGRTPLHYAAALKDGNHMTNFLTEHGASESAVDNKEKPAAYYKGKTHEIDQKLLIVLPECPRTPRDNFNFDWNMLTKSYNAEDANNTLKRNGKHINNGNGVKEVSGVDITRNVSPEAENDLSKGGDSPKEASDASDEKDSAERVDDDSNINTEKHTLETDSENIPAQDQEKSSNNQEDYEEHLENENQLSTEKEEHLENENKLSIEKEDEVNETPEHGSSDDENKQDLGDAESGEKVSDPIEKGNSPNNENSDTEINVQSPIHVSNGQKDHLKDITHENDETRPDSKASNSSVRSVMNSEIANAKSNKENNDNNNNDDIPDIESEGVIEGVVNGEDEVETLNEQGQEANDKSDDEIRQLVESGNMEQLAALVLNGEGERLIGQQSSNPELQSFLDNVPMYMDKINRIHLAARNGSLRDLQAALDRRKFAIAKDNMSPNGASPLHVAVIFGNTSIVRYLAGRFPETVQVVDDNGRTPLHYAACLADNGHYYNLLVHLGANTKSEDNFGRVPEYYITNQKEMYHRGLLADFGAEDSVVDEMLSDKAGEGDVYSARKDLDDEDMMGVLERCYNVLHGYTNFASASAISSTTISSSSSVHAGPLLSKHLRKYIFDTVKYRLTRLDHNLYDLIWPSVKKLPNDTNLRTSLEQDFPAGIVAPDLYVYKVFQELLVPIIKDLNSIDQHFDLKNHPLSIFVKVEENISLDEDRLAKIDLDPENRWIISGGLECTRNLQNFELPKSLNISQLESVERIVTNVLLSFEVAQVICQNVSNEDISEKGSGIYYTLTEVLEDPSEARVLLAAAGLLIPLWNIPDSDRLHGKHWPYGRGVFIDQSCSLAVWVNVLDHIRIVTRTPESKPGSVGEMYLTLHHLINTLNRHLQFRWDEKIGYLSSRPTALGNTLKFNLTMKFTYLIKEPDNLKHLCLVRGLTYYRHGQNIDLVKIGNQQSVGVTEIQTLEDFTTAVANMLQLEKDMAMSNSIHIAALFVNIFKRKKSSLTGD